VLGLVEIYQGKNGKSGSHMRAEYRILTAGRRVGFFRHRFPFLRVFDVHQGARRGRFHKISVNQ
jgi:hypothetical protein